MKRWGIIILAIIGVSMVSKVESIESMSPERMAMVDAWYWLYSNNIQLSSGPYTLVDHEFQVPWLQSEAQFKCCRKATQGGYTECEVGETLHGCIHGKYPHGVGIYFPGQNEVTDFSKARFGPIIQRNPETIGRYVTNTDTANLKQVGNSFIYFKGARLNQTIENIEKESSALRSFSTDKSVFDEWDLIDKKAAAKARGRMGHSEIEREDYLSNPTIPGYGIDKLYEESDQGLWMVRCSACGKETCMEKEFPKCVRLLDRPNKRMLDNPSVRPQTGIRVCIYCGNEIFPRDGHRVAQFPNRSGEMEGYWYSKLQLGFKDPGIILKRFLHPPEGNVGDVYRLDLGMAHIEAENKLTVQQVYECCGDDVMAMNDTGPCAMGVDVGKVLHVKIGKRITEKTIQVVYANRVDSFNDLHDLGQRFNVQCAVIDWEPETRMVRRFRDAEPYAVYGCDYLDRAKKEVNTFEEDGLIAVGRTETLDWSHREISNQMIILPRRSTEIEQVATEMTNTAKVFVTEGHTLRRVGRYIPLGPDHYRHACGYMLLAARNVQIAGTGGYKTSGGNTNWNGDLLGLA